MVAHASFPTSRERDENFPLSRCLLIDVFFLSFKTPKGDSLFSSQHSPICFPNQTKMDDYTHFPLFIFSLSLLSSGINKVKPSKKSSRISSVASKTNLHESISFIKGFTAEFEGKIEDKLASQILRT